MITHSEALHARTRCLPHLQRNAVPYDFVRHAQPRHVTKVAYCCLHNNLNRSLPFTCHGNQFYATTTDGHTHSRQNAMWTTIAERIGDELYAACGQDDVSQVQTLTSTTSHAAHFWCFVLTAAVDHGATNVVAYCIEKGVDMAYIDEVLQHVVCNKNSEPVYRQMIDFKTVDVNYNIDRSGVVLG